MRVLEINGAQCLAEWLEIATINLIPSAKERIRLEVEAHFADSVLSHMARGSSELGAQAVALTELGDAAAAAKRFRRRYLTAAEAQQVQESFKSAKSPFRLLIDLLLNGLFYAYFLHVLKRYHVPFLVPTVILFICPMLRLIDFFLPRRKSSKSEIRLVFLMDMLAMGSLTMFLAWLAIWGDWGPFFCMSISLPIYLNRNLRILFKLGQVDCIWPEVPAHRAPTS